MINQLEYRYINSLTKILPLENIKWDRGEIIVSVSPKNIHSVLYFLKNHHNALFHCLTAVSGTDYPGRKNRFEVAYELLSLQYNRRIRVKTFVDGATYLPSATSIFPAANWYEREVFDLYGVFFYNHPDLRRILTDYGFQGHPMRKDFPLTGYVEVAYDEKLKRVISQPLELSQEFRYFDFRSPWSQKLNFVKKP